MVGVPIDATGGGDDATGGDDFTTLDDVLRSLVEDVDGTSDADKPEADDREGRTTVTWDLCDEPAKFSLLVDLAVLPVDPASLPVDLRGCVPIMLPARLAPGLVDASLAARLRNSE